jgi:hypothetical protein
VSLKDEQETATFIMLPIPQVPNRMRAFIAAALLCLAAQGVLGEEKAGDRKLLQQELVQGGGLLCMSV